MMEKWWKHDGNMWISSGDFVNLWISLIVPVGPSPLGSHHWVNPPGDHGVQGQQAVADGGESDSRHRPVAVAGSKGAMDGAKGPWPSYGAVKDPSQIIQNCSRNLLKPIETLCGSTLWCPVSAWGLGFFRGVIRVGKLSSEHWWIADGLYDIHNTQWVSNDSECTLNNHEYMMDG